MWHLLVLSMALVRLGSSVPCTLLIRTVNTRVSILGHEEPCTVEGQPISTRESEMTGGGWSRVAHCFPCHALREQLQPVKLSFLWLLLV